MKDMVDNVNPVPTVQPQAITGAFAGTGVDISLYRGTLLQIHFGAITGTTPNMTAQWEESNDNSTWAAISNANLVAQSTYPTATNGVTGNTTIGVAANPNNFLVGAANSVNKLGYIGVKRYLRLNVTAVTGTTPSFTTEAAVIGGGPMRVPV